MAKGRRGPADFGDHLDYAHLKGTDRQEYGPIVTMLMDMEGSTRLGVLLKLEALFAYFGAPAYLKRDNGPEFVAETVRKWLAQKGVQTHYIAPGSP
ncbi:MAG: transposase family protein [Xanthomonadaceae bacterium]|nr:transposase family protein [Xanthomonadaceae bacterium]